MPQIPNPQLGPEIPQMSENNVCGLHSVAVDKLSSNVPVMALLGPEMGPKWAQNAIFRT